MDNKKIILSKPYEFEGVTYTEIDLQRLDDLTGKDLVEIEKIFISRGNNPGLGALSHDYAYIVAQRITKKPIEFFESLPAKDAIALKDKIFYFFHGED
jgi:hypothetical protein